MSLPTDHSIVSVRLAVAGDAETIASVLYQAFVEYQSLYTPAAFAATTLHSDRIRSRFGEGPVWVAMQNDLVVGTVSAVTTDRGTYVRGMALLPAARGRRVGWLLLESVEGFAREHKLRRLFLSTTPFLLRAIRLYEQFGFQRDDEGPHELFGTPLFTMVKNLSVAAHTA
ncbi:MAG: GNAT family N-acetyltransferase [Anaerolineales bacterium]